MPNSLILLVGSNPLPNYLAAMALKPETIYLVYTSETEPPKNRLRQALIGDLKPAPHVEADVFIDDASDAAEIADKIAALVRGKTSGIHLHYTGGTKVMSAHALHSFYEHGGDKNNASYLDETNVRLRFDGGGTRPCEVTLTLERLLGLHGITHKPRSHVVGGPTEADVQAIATAVWKDPELASCHYRQRERLKGCNLEAAKQAPFRPAEHGLELSLPAIPGSDTSKKAFECWYKFIGGEWLEEWVAIQIEATGLASGSEITTGVNAKRAESARPLEVDVAVIRGQRSYFISCTTDATISVCKSKAFEITARSRQMGGDLARSAIVCLLPSSKGNDRPVDQLKADLADAWGATNTTLVFGLEDLRSWAGDYGSPNLDELKTWLKS